METVLTFPTDRAVVLEPAAWDAEAELLRQRERARIRRECTAGAHVDTILRTPLAGIPRVGDPGHGAVRSANIRAVFRALGWGKFLRVTKGGYSLGTSIQWAKAHDPEWRCPASVERNLRGEWGIYCGCDTCEHRRRQRDAIARRVHYVLNVAFVGPRGGEFGNRSDTMSDYFDADYTFHP